MNKSESRRIAKRIVRCQRQLSNPKLDSLKASQRTEQMNRLSAIPLLVTSPV